ncbi:MAG: sulfotransferase [Pirellulales bacterium]
MADLTIALQAIPARVEPRPILVLGNHKSGTTAIAALLAEIAGYPVTLDLAREVKHPTYQTVRGGRMSIDAFVQRNKLDFSRKIIKEPNFIVIFDQLRARFPDAKMVFVVRDPRDDLRSILNRLRLPGDLQQLDQPYRGVNARAWNLYLDGHWAGIEADHYIEVLAGRWKLAAQMYLDHRDAMERVRYEDFEQDKAGEIGRLAERLGLPRPNDIRDKVDFPYQPAGDRSIDWPSFFGLGNLQRIERVCGETMIPLGYRPLLQTESADESPDIHHG